MFDTEIRCCRSNVQKIQRETINMMTSTSEIPSDLGSTLAGYSVKELHQHYQSLMDLLKSNATNSSGRRKMSLLRPKEPHFDQEGEQLYCSCQQPDDCSFMIQCDTCKEWYVSLTAKVFFIVDSRLNLFSIC